MINFLYKNRRDGARSLVALLSLLLLTALVGCSEPQSLKCAFNETEVNGQCQPISCAKDKTICPIGSYCSVDKKCLTGRVATCKENKECGGNARCVDNRCVNPSWCHFNYECQVGYDCSDGVCRPSKCADPKSGVKDCRDGGTCNDSVKKCEAKASCNPSTELIDCLQGQKCIKSSAGGSNKCLTGDEFCAQNPSPCSRGVCNPKTYSCVDKPNCSADSDCLLGKYCSSSSHTCQASSCSENTNDCSGGGVCDPTTGTCNNSPDCTKKSDCLSGYECVFYEPKSTKRTGVCLDSNLTDKEKCQDRCTGAQTCESKEDYFYCKEPDTCVNARDCLAGNVCQLDATTNSNKCQKPLLCSTNDTNQGTATQPVELSSSVTGQKICSGTDYYTYTPTGSLGTDVVLVFRLEIPENELGLGKVVLSVTSGNLTQEVSIDADGTSLDNFVTTSLNNVTTQDHIKIEVKVDKKESAKDIPMHYNLSVSKKSAQLNNACKEGHDSVLKFGEVNNLQWTPQSSTLLKDCADPKGDIPESVSKLHLDQAAGVSFAVYSDPKFLPSISIQKSCEDKDVSRGCEKETGTLFTILDPGDYYVYVQARSAKEGEHVTFSQKEPFQLFVDKTPLQCKLSEIRCVQDLTTNQYYTEYCPFKRDGLVKKQCQGGCSGSGGVGSYCQDWEAQSCLFAPVVDATHPYHKTKVDFSYTLVDNNTDSLKLSNICGNVTPSDTIYAEKVFAVKVPENGQITATATNLADPGGPYNIRVNRYNFYLLDTCDGTTNSCFFGKRDDSLAINANASNTMTWFNDSGKERTVYLVVDSSPHSGLFDTDPKANIDIDVKQLACQPDHRFCAGDDLKECSSDGSNDSKILLTCQNGCDIDHCKGPINGDSCSHPIELTTKPLAVDFDILNAEDKHGLPFACSNGGTNTPVGGPEYVFHYKVKDITKPAVYTFSVNTPGKGGNLPSEFYIWSSRECSASPEYDSQICATGKSSSTSIDVTFDPNDSALNNPDLFFFVDSADHGQFRIALQEKKGLDKNCLDNSGNVEAGKVLPCNNGKILYCTKEGILQDYQCDSCKNKDLSCVTHKGGFCEDAIIVDTTVTSSMPDTFASYKLPLTGVSQPFDKNVSHGSCLFDENVDFDAPEKIFKFHIGANKKLTVDFAPSDSDSHLQAYFRKDCSKVDTCLASRHYGTQQLTYTSGGKEDDIYMIVDGPKQLSDGRFRFKWHTDDVNPTIQCQPNQFICDSSDKQNVSYCLDGSSQAAEVKCPGILQCKNGACDIPSQPVTCENTTLNVQSDKKPHYFTWSTKDLVPRATSCHKMDGNLQYFKVQANAGETISVTAGAMNNQRTSAFIFTDCEDPGASCEAFADAPKAVADLSYYTLQKDLSFKYTAPKGGTYIVAIGTLESNQQAGKETQLYATIKVLATCSVTGNPCKLDNGEYSIHYCELGVEEKAVCHASTRGCDNDISKMSYYCSNVNSDLGSTCFIPKVLRDAKNATLTTSGEYSDGIKKTDKHQKNRMPYTSWDKDSSQLSGVCGFQNFADFADKYYAVYLNKDEHLHVELNAVNRSSMTIYLLGDCGKQTCVARDMQDGSFRDRTIDYVATENKPYYIVVSEGRDEGAADMPSSSNPLPPIKYRLKWEVTPSSTLAKVAKNTTCVPFLAQCYGHDVHVCNPAGTEVLSSACATGTTCQEGGTCIPDTYLNHSSTKGVNICSDAIDVSATQRISVPFSRLTNSGVKNLESCSDRTNLPAEYRSKQTSGKDAFFHLVIPQGKNVKIWAQSTYFKKIVNDQHTTQIPTFDTIAYSTYDDNTCEDSKCSEGGVHSFRSAGRYEVVTILEGDPSAKKDIYLRVSSFNKNVNPVRTFFFDFFTPECTLTNKNKVCTTDKKGIKYCVKGEYRTHFCSIGTCHDGTAGGPPQCLDSNNQSSGDVCLEAIPVDLTSVKSKDITGSFRGHQNSFNLARDAKGCSGDVSPGRDIVYAVKLNANQTLNATLTPTGTALTPSEKDLSLYLTATCPMRGEVSSCLANSDKNGLGADDNSQKSVETLTYTATKDETVYLIVDSFWVGLKSDYKLSLTVN